MARARRVTATFRKEDALLLQFALDHFAAQSRDCAARVPRERTSVRDRHLERAEHAEEVQAYIGRRLQASEDLERQRRQEQRERERAGAVAARQIKKKGARRVR